MNKQIKRGLSLIHRRFYKLLDPQNKYHISIPYFKKVAKLDEGKSFGERALIKNELRAATVYCSQDSHFATLSRGDFNKIIG
jgi:hypothetical protein